MTLLFAIEHRLHGAAHPDTPFAGSGQVLTRGLVAYPASAGHAIRLRISTADHSVTAGGVCRRRDRELLLGTGKGREIERERLRCLASKHHE